MDSFVIRAITAVSVIMLASCGAVTPETPADVETGASSSALISSVPVMSSAMSFAQDSAEWSAPISRHTERVTKKPFAIRIDPATSPVQPERFSGYHTGTDFEAFEDEEGQEVTISAICDGAVRFTGFVNGYGGVLIQDCTLEDRDVTVLYGHLAAGSITASKSLKAGERIGRLGEEGPETDGERKHLHLSIHRGNTISYRGYVATKDELDAWVDPMGVLR